MHGHARFRERSQITLPSFVVERMKLEVGSIVEFALNDRGAIELQAAKIVKAGTPQARLEEALAKKEIEQGKYTEIRGADDLDAYTKRVRNGQNSGDSDLARTQAQGIEAAEIGSPVEFEITLPAEMTGARESVKIKCKGRVVRAAEGGEVYRIHSYTDGHAEIAKDRG